MQVDIFVLTSIKTPRKQKGRYAYLLRYIANNGKEVTYWDGAHEIEEATQNSAELTALIESLKHLKTACDLRIYTDCGYLKNGIENWLSGWIKANWITSRGEPVANMELWQDIVQRMSIHCPTLILREHHEFYNVMLQELKGE